MAFGNKDIEGECTDLRMNKNRQALVGANARVKRHRAAEGQFTPGAAPVSA